MRNLLIYVCLFISLAATAQSSLTIMPQMALPTYAKYICLNSQQKLLALADEHTVQIVDLNSNLVVFQGPITGSMFSQAITGLAFGQGNLLYMRFENYTIDKEKQRQFIPGQATIYRFNYLDGVYLPPIFQRCISLDLEGNWHFLPSQPWALTQVAFSGGKIFLAGDTSVIAVMDDNWRQIQTIHTGTRTCDFLGTYDDGSKIIVVNKKDGIMKIYDVQSAELLFSYSVTPKKITENNKCYEYTAEFGNCPCELGISAPLLDAKKGSFVFVETGNKLVELDLKSYELTSQAIPDSTIIGGFCSDQNSEKSFFIVRKSVNIKNDVFVQDAVAEVSFRNIGAAKYLQFRNAQVNVLAADYADSMNDIVVATTQGAATWDGKSYQEKENLSPFMENGVLGSINRLGTSTYAKIYFKYDGGHSSQKPSSVTLYSCSDFINPKSEISFDSQPNSEIVGISPTGKYYLTSSHKGLEILDTRNKKLFHKTSYAFPYNSNSFIKPFDGNQTFISENGDWLFLKDTLRKCRILLNSKHWEEKYIIPCFGKTVFFDIDCKYKFVSNHRFVAFELRNVIDTVSNNGAHCFKYIWRVHNLVLDSENVKSADVYDFIDFDTPTDIFMNHTENIIGAVYPTRPELFFPARMIFKSCKKDSTIGVNYLPNGYGNVSHADFCYGDSSLILSEGSFVSFYRFRKQTTVANLYLNFNYNQGILEGSFFTPALYYMGKSDIGSYAFSYKGRAYPVGQFDLKYNRPDLVATQLGAAASLLESYHNAYLKKLKFYGLPENDIPLDEIPNLYITNDSNLDISRTKCISIKVSASDRQSKIVRYRIWVNGVPENSKDLIFEPDYNISRNVKINLSFGENRVSVQAVNENGIASIKKVVTISYCPKDSVHPIVYFLGIGVDRYLDSTNHKLFYAVKDINNLRDAIKIRYPDSKSIVFKNEEVTTGLLQKMASFISAAKEDDIIIISLSGHGLRDSVNDFCFAMYNTDFDYAKKRPGISYSDLNSVFKGNKCRKRLITLDACNSGDLDKEKGMRIDTLNNFSDGQVIGRGHFAQSNEEPIGESSFDLMQNLFYNFNAQDGNNIIAASAGSEVAFEGPEWHNGLFTYVLIKALLGRKADTNIDDKISVLEISNYVYQQVRALSHGRQHPGISSIDLENDWILW